MDLEALADAAIRLYMCRHNLSYGLEALRSDYPMTPQELRDLQKEMDTTEQAFEDLEEILDMFNIVTKKHRIQAQINAGYRRITLGTPCKDLQELQEYDECSQLLTDADYYQTSTSLSIWLKRGTKGEY